MDKYLYNLKQRMNKIKSMKLMNFMIMFLYALEDKLKRVKQVWKKQELFLIKIIKLK